MRFLHKDLAPLKAHLLAAPNEIKRLEWDLNPIIRGPMAIFSFNPKRRPADRPRPGTVDEIETTFRRAANPELAGTVLLEYFHVNAPPSERAVSMAAAIEHVEAYGGPTEFLIVGYPDGGVISVSRYVLPFQEGSHEATWWAREIRWP
jgi:hypothetical protein